MGAVFRARDHRTGRTVAVKLVDGALADARFEREATLLSTLENDGIVGYVAHGKLPDGRAYLAMEWLEGESLEARVARGSLTIEESLAVARRVARALASAHALGIVHRDVKPGNIILRDSDPSRAMLVDFGIARASESSGTPRALTQTGVAIGTPAFMAPEQARGERAVDGRADVFSLGAVLFECLTGRSAFVGEHVVAVLAKVLLEPAPRVRSIRRDVPAALDELVANMLEKEPARRPADVVRALEELDLDALIGSSPRLSLGPSEQRYATVLLARPVQAESDETDKTQGAEIVRVASLHGVMMYGLANGSFVATMPAESAAKYAHAMLEGAPDTVIAIATGRAIVAGQVPVGEAIDRAAKLLLAHERSPGVWLDDATAAIADARGERVMGRVAPFVGRDREMALLEATYRECVDDSVVAATLFLAPPGVGKSRLRRELAERLRASDTPPAVWLGLAHPLMSASPLAFLADVAGRALGVSCGMAGARSRIPDPFLGELLGVPFDDADVPALRAARSNPKLLADQVTEAFLALALAELAERPLLITLEDVHSADAASLRAIEALLARAKDLPLFVVALARPAVDEAHPRLWSEHHVQRVTLEPLRRKPAERLARALVGEGVDVEAIVRRAEGNALFVEELARATVGGGVLEELPPTLAAVAEARLMSLDGDARQVLRAGAVFGERFWRGAVASLVDVPVDPPLLTLEQREIVTTASSSRFAGERELVFRHAIVRDAAYAMLTDDDRRLGHSLAADWLAARVDDPALLAHHYERGGRLAEAAEAHVRAAEHAVYADDRAAIRVHVAHARRCGVSGHLEGRLLLALLDSAVWHGENAEAIALGEPALALLERGSPPWFVAAGGWIAALGKLGRTSEMLEVVKRIEATPSRDPSVELPLASAARAVACARAAIQVLYLGEPEWALRLLDAASRVKGEPSVDGALADAAFDFKFLAGRILHPDISLRARERFAELGDRRGALGQSSNAVMSLALIGAPDEGLRVAERFGANAYVIALCRAVKAAHGGDLGPMRALPDTIPVERQRSGQRSWSTALLLPTDRAEAKAELDRAFAGVLPPGIRSVALALKSRLSKGDEAMALFEEALEQSARGIVAIGPCILALAHVEALEGVGRHAEVPQALREALLDLESAAAELGEWGPVYLERGLCVAELREMARARGLGR